MGCDVASCDCYVNISFRLQVFFCDGSWFPEHWFHHFRYLWPSCRFWFSLWFWNFEEAMAGKDRVWCFLIQIMYIGDTILSYRSIWFSSSALSTSLDIRFYFLMSIAKWHCRRANKNILEIWKYLSQPYIASIYYMQEKVRFYSDRTNDSSRSYTILAYLSSYNHISELKTRNVWGGCESKYLYCLVGTDLWTQHAWKETFTKFKLVTPCFVQSVIRTFVKATVIH